MDGGAGADAGQRDGATSRGQRCVGQLNTGICRISGPAAYGDVAAVADQPAPPHDHPTTTGGVLIAFQDQVELAGGRGDVGVDCNIIVSLQLQGCIIAVGL